MNQLLKPAPQVSFLGLLRVLQQPMQEPEGQGLLVEIRALRAWVSQPSRQLKKGKTLGQGLNIIYGSQRDGMGWG